VKLEFEMDTYKSEIKPTWCPGCGDFAVLRALQMSIHALQLEPWNILVVSGIGCSSNLPHFLSTYGFHAIHGRALPVAEGAKLARSSSLEATETAMELEWATSFTPCGVTSTSRTS